MKNAADLLAELRRQGFQVEAGARGVRVHPASNLTAELRDAIRERNTELLALLRAPKPTEAPIAAKPRPAVRVTPSAPVPSPSPPKALPPPPATAAVNRPPTNAMPTPPAALQTAPPAPELICFKCIWDPPRQPTCPRCAWEREKARRYGTQSVITVCRNCRQLPPGSAECPSCSANRKHAKLVGREHEGILTEYSDPQAEQAWIDNWLGRNRG